MSQTNPQTPRQKNRTKTALYPYTLQPVALGMTDTEFKAAQLALFEKTAQQVSLKSIRQKEWIAMGVVVVLSIAGLIFLQDYSTIFFWIMLAGVVIYLLLRTLGLKWYMRREFDKQVSGMSMPDELHKLKLGVQSHGLIMAIPAGGDVLNAPHLKGMNMRQAPMQQGVIPWSAVDQWDETDAFVFIMFNHSGQKGSQIIPKRLDGNGLPIATIIKHLQAVMPKGLKTDGLTA